MNISIFNNSALYEATTGLFTQLGIPLLSNTEQALDAKMILNEFFQEREPFTCISQLYFAGLVDDRVFTNNSPNGYSLEEALQQAGRNYEGLMVFTLELSKRPTRSELSELTRTFNRISQKMPIAIVFKYGQLISLALSERFTYKQEWREGERVGKVVILKDIDTIHPHAAHLRILFGDNSGKKGLKIDAQKVKTYNDLWKYWQTQFSIQALNNQFYGELQEWFYFASQNITLPFRQPYHTEKENVKNFLVRLLSRMMFCWFIKEKGLIQPELLELSDYRGTNFKLTGDVEEEGFLQNNSYYRGVLQNIFFRSLNQKEKKNAKDFKWRKYLSETFDYSWLTSIPYLNGGIFDILPEDNVKESNEDTVIKIPNFLFYGDAEHKGLNQILKSFKFTLEENTPYEEDIALDPEMLGLVFENLLAELDSNLEENAIRSIRRLTGSYYTPRKIIREMVNDALFIYLKKNINPDHETLLYQLVYQDAAIDEPDFNERIVAAIDRFKMLDPACGSGAFPMGMLHRLVDILKIVDSNNEKWLRLKLKPVDPNYRDEFEKTLKQHVDDYSRKLGIIRDSIYGIDIQPLAVQITKLRFFISLLIDQKTESGITPMPNIETKIICADSLKDVNADLFKDEAIAQLSEARRKYYQPNLSHEVKEKIADEIAEILSDAFPTFAKQATGRTVAEQNKHLIKDWFMHGVLAAPFFNCDYFYPELKTHGGFDCVMGNPPYGGAKISNEVRHALDIESKDPYGAFIARFLSSPDRPTPLKEGGVLAFIVSDTFMTIKSHLKLRRQMMNNYIHKMIRVHPDTFRATVNTAIIICERYHKQENDKNHICQMADMTNISIHDDYSRFTEILRQTEGVAFSAQKQSVSNAEYAIYYYPQQLIRSNSNLPFFVASPKLFALMNDGNDAANPPKTAIKEIGGKQVQVRTICLNGKEIEVVKLGDIAEVKQGLATGDNNSYLFQNPEARGTYRSIHDYRDYLLTEVDLEKIRNNETLRLEVIDKGISKDNLESERYFEGRYIIPYDKGGESDSEGGWLPNYYVPTNYFIDWSEWAVNRMKNYTIAQRIIDKNESKTILPHYKTQAAGVFRNTETYFTKSIGFSDTGVYAPTFRFNSSSIFDVMSMSIFLEYQFEDILSLLSTKVVRYIIKHYINHSIHTQVEGVKPIPVFANLSKGSKSILISIIQSQKSNPRYDYASHEQVEIDKLVYEAYGLQPEDVEEVENWYARRYSKLSEAQKQNLRCLGKSDDYLALYGYKSITNY